VVVIGFDRPPHSINSANISTPFWEFPIAVSTVSTLGFNKLGAKIIPKFALVISRRELAQLFCE